MKDLADLQLEFEKTITALNSINDGKQLE